jgi:hypothetical protein
VHQPNFDRPDPVMERFINSVCKGGTPLPKVTAMGWQPGRVWASYKSFTGMRSAALKYRVNPLPQVQDSLTTWTTIPGTVDTVQKIVSATVPANGFFYYLMLTDNDGMLVTADHVDLTIDPSSGFFRLNTPLSDSTPPPKVTGLQAVVPVSGRVNLQWNAVADPESGINGYNIYRNDLLVTMSNGSSYVDSGLPELTSFTYRVAAVNKAYLEGARSDPAAAAMPADNVPPIVLSATVNGDPQVVRVVFSELVEKASAERAANYAVSGGITVQSATLSSDGKSVVLATSALASTVSYTITVNNVRDRAAAPNTITANARIAITYNPYAPGLSYDYFDAAFSSVDGVAAAVSPRSTGVTPTVSLDPALTNQNFALRFTGYIDIPVSGAYTFYTTSDDGSALYIGSTKVVNNDGAHGMQEAQGVINLTAGKVALTVLYYQGNGGLGLQASWSGPGVAKQLIPASALYHVASSGLTATAFPGNAKGAATANGVRMSILTALTGQPSLRLEMPSAIISPQMVTIGLFDQRGRRIAGVEASYGPGSHTIPLRVGQLARGLYVCRMTIGASERCIPFAVTR